MKKKILLLPLISLMLMSCVTTPSSSSESNSSESSSNESSSSEESSSSGNTSSSGEADKTNIAEIRDIGLSFANQVNDRKVYTSQIKATFTAQLLTIHDTYTTENGYTNRYKALVANETGYIFVTLSNAGYKYVSDYVADQQVYIFTGLIGIYCGEPEVVMESAATPTLSGVTLNYNLDNLATTVDSVSDAYDTIKTLQVNTKGTGASSRIVKMTLRYLEKVENAVALFTDGEHVIQAHGDSKMNNGFSEDVTYDITAILIIYHFKPELKFIAKKISSQEVDFSYDIATGITSTSLYNLSYDEDHPAYASNYTYAESFIKVYHFEGYANFYTKDNADNIVFDDVAKDAYSTQENAKNAKAMFANNNNCLALKYSADYANCPFWEYAYPEKAKVEFYFVAYLLNTNDYWQIQIFEDTIAPVL